MVLFWWNHSIWGSGQTPTCHISDLLPRMTKFRNLLCRSGPVGKRLPEQEFRELGRDQTWKKQIFDNERFDNEFDFRSRHRNPWSAWIIFVHWRFAVPNRILLKGYRSNARNWIVFPWNSIKGMRIVWEWIWFLQSTPNMMNENIMKFWYQDPFLANDAPGPCLHLCSCPGLPRTVLSSRPARI